MSAAVHTHGLHPPRWAYSPQGGKTGVTIQKVRKQVASQWLPGAQWYVSGLCRIDRCKMGHGLATEMLVWCVMPLADYLLVD